MKKGFILFGMLIVCVGLFAEGIPKDPHLCLDYYNASDQVLNTEFISDWFDHLEEADDNSGYDEEFLQEHGGRVGVLILRETIKNGVDCEAIEDEEEEDYDVSTYSVWCSGTLIGEKYFLTAGHCAEKIKEPKEGACRIVKNVGVLFGYQIADLEDNSITHPEYPRVSLKRYLDETGNYRQYGGGVGKPANFTEHPAYFPIIENTCNFDGSVEHGWHNICWTDDDDQEITDFAPEMKWPDGQILGEMDFAIYELGRNSNLNLPFEEDDPWPWVSENNQDDGAAEKIWTFLDNTNGKRGWARVNTAVQQTGSTLNVIGHPWVSRANDGVENLYGLKIVNAGYVVEGATRKNARAFNEDVLVFERADIWYGNSGSSVLDNHGRLAGLVSWFGCFQGYSEENPYQVYQISPTLQDLPTPPIPPIPPVPTLATNYATPMWKICRASQIIKNAAKDMDCNGWIDWDDLISAIRIDFSHFINIGIEFDLIKDFVIPTTVEKIHIHRIDMDQKKVITETREIPAYTYQVAWSDNGDFFYLTKQSNAFYLFKNGTALGTVSNAPEISGSSTLVKGDDIYLAGGYTANIRSNDFSPYITKISSDGQNGYSFSMVADLPSDFEDIRIFSLGNDIYVSGNTDNSFVIYELVPNNQGERPYTLSLVSDTSQPVRKDYNLTAADGKIIVSGGATDNITNIIDLEESQYDPDFSVYGNIIMLEPSVSDDWVTVAENINDKIILLSVTAIDDGNLVIVNPFITVGNSMQKIVMDLSEIPINNENIRVSFEFHPVGFCLSESDSSFTGGMETSGECVPFTHPFYNSFSAGTSVYSVAGKGNRLYAGTNDSIKIYDISDQNSPVLVSSFSTNNARVNDLEIEGEVLFAATSKGLYKLDASDPDELDQILFVSTGSTSQNEIELYDGKVYVGDDNGIKIRDKETLSVLLSANSGQVYDFAIENGEIAMFRSSFWNSGIQFRNAETLVETAYDYTSCNDVEVENFNGKLYLACDNYNYSFEANNGYIYFTQLSGDKRDLRENYTYNGYTYTPDGNYIRLSTNEEVQAICGNGIVEGDEVCDGTPIDCTELDENYVSGIAACNSTCDGYVLDNCTAENGGDGW